MPYNPTNEPTNYLNLSIYLSIYVLTYACICLAIETLSAIVMIESRIIGSWEKECKSKNGDYENKKVGR